MPRLMAAVAISLALFHYWTGWGGGLPFVQQRVVHIGFSITVIWLGILAIRSRGRGRDALAIAALLGSLGLLGFLFFNDDWLLHLSELASWPLLLWSALLLVFLIETTRRVVGLVLPLLALGLGAFMLVARNLPVANWFAPTSLQDIAHTMSFSDHGILGSITGVSAGVVAAFLVLGSLLSVSGGAQSFLNLARFAVGRYRGGPAKVSLVTSALFGTVSGSAIANVVVDGVFNIPLMKRSGYKPEFAAAVEAVASTGGQLVPPVMGAAAFLLAQFLDIPYSEVIVAAIIPAVLYYVAIFISVHIEALKRDLPAIPKEQLPKAGELVSREFVFSFVLPIAVLLYFMYSGRSMLFASFAASTATIGYMLLDLRQPIRARVVRVFDGFRMAGMEIARMTTIVIGAQIVVTLLGMSGVGSRIANEIANVDIPIELALVVLAAVIIVLGFGVPTSAAYVLAASIAGPIFVAMGIDKFAGHFFIFYLAVFSAVTPPIMPAVYAAVGIARSRMMMTGVVASQLIAPAALIPFVFVLEPALLLREESLLPTVYAFVRVAVGMVAVAAGLASWFGRPMPAWAGALVTIGGALVAWPTDASTIAGLVLLAIGGSTLVRAARRPSVERPRSAVVAFSGGRSSSVDAPAWERLVSGMRGVLFENEVGPSRGIVVAAPYSSAVIALVRALTDLGASATFMTPASGPGAVRDHRDSLAFAVVTNERVRSWAEAGFTAYTPYDLRLLAVSRVGAVPSGNDERTFSFVGSGPRVDRRERPTRLRKTVAGIAAAFRLLPTDRVHVSLPPNDPISPIVLAAVDAAGATVVADEEAEFEPERWLSLVGDASVSTAVMSTAQLLALVAYCEREATAIPTSLSAIVHGRMPLPAAAKHRAVAVFGPILLEYWCTPDARGGTVIANEDWLENESSVGRPWSDDVTIRVVDARGAVLAAGEVGHVVLVIDGAPVETDVTGRLDNGGSLVIDGDGRPMPPDLAAMPAGSIS